MKKLIGIIVAIILIPFIVKAETCEPEKVIIERADIQNISENVQEKEKPEIEGRKINVNLSMTEVGDVIEYRLVIKNGSREDYELNENSIINNSDYINYSLKSKDSNKIIKAGESKEVYLRIEYGKSVDQTKFVNGVYQDNKNMVVNLSTQVNDNSISNPETGNHFIFTCLISVGVIIGVMILIKKQKNVKYMILLMGIFIISPILVSGLCKCDIVLDSKVEIRNEEKFKIELECSDTSPKTLVDQLPMSISYLSGMTWKNFIESSYYERLGEDIQHLIVDSVGYGLSFRPIEQINCINQATTSFEEDDCYRESSGYPTIYNINEDSIIESQNNGLYLFYTYCVPS